MSAISTSYHSESRNISNCLIKSYKYLNENYPKKNERSGDSNQEPIRLPKKILKKHQKIIQDAQKGIQLVDRLAEDNDYSADEKRATILELCQAVDQLLIGDPDLEDKALMVPSEVYTLHSRLQSVARKYADGKEDEFFYKNSKICFTPDFHHKTSPKDAREAIEELADYYYANMSTWAQRFHKQLTNNPEARTMDLPLCLPGKSQYACQGKMVADKEDHSVRLILEMPIKVAHGNYKWINLSIELQGNQKPRLGIVSYEPIADLHHEKTATLEDKLHQLASSIEGVAQKSLIVSSPKAGEMMVRYSRYYELGSLDQQKDMLVNLPHEDQEEVVKQMEDAVRSFHQVTGCIHNDIKPGNFLGQIDSQTGKFRIALNDFGLSTPPQQVGIIRGGTIPYMAPEYFQRKVGAEASTDTYALGMTILEIFQIIDINKWNSVCFDHGRPNKELYRMVNILRTNKPEEILQMRNPKLPSLSLKVVRQAIDLLKEVKK